MDVSTLEMRSITHTRTGQGDRLDVAGLGWASTNRHTTKQNETTLFPAEFMVIIDDEPAEMVPGYKGVAYSTIHTPDPRWR